MFTMTIDNTKTGSTRFAIVTDFSEIITQLRAGGVRLKIISEMTAIPRTNLMRYLFDGATPGHPTGEALIALWCSRFGKTRGEVPTRPPIGTAARIQH